MKIVKLDAPVELRQSDVSSEEQFFRLKKSNRPATGRVTLFDQNGNLERRFNIRRGLRHGLFEQFFANGDINYWCIFANGKLDFFDETWDKYGRLTSSECWLNGDLHGTSKKYELNNLVEHSEFLHGNRHGLTEKYGLRKVTLFHGQYIDDEPHRWHVERYTNGKRKEEQCWDKGVRIGHWRSFFESGKVQHSMHYKDGVKVGEDILYYENGVIAGVTEFVDGIAEGVSYSYYSNGTLSDSRPFKKGVLNGTQRAFNQDQSLAFEIVWVDGVMISEVIHIQERQWLRQRSPGVAFKT